MENTLERFVTAHQQSFATALSEVRAGKKRSHWMWYIFPQLAGLANSETSKYYSINDLHEARLFLQHPVLGDHLITISGALLELETSDPAEIFGYPDNLKLRSSMTLFAQVPASHRVFQQVLDKFFAGMTDPKSIQLLQ